MDAPRWTALLTAWDRGDGPRYARLARTVQAHIRSGRVRPGEALPAERALAALLGLSRSTVVAAYDELGAGGWVTRRRGSGTHVSPAAPRPGEVLTLRTPVRPGDAADGRATDELDLTIAVPLLTEDQRLQMQEAARGAFRESLYYPLGLPELRAELAGMYARAGLPTRAEDVLITSGAQQAIALSAGALLRRGDRVVLESPTYFGAIDVFRAVGAELHAVPVGAQGVSGAVLREVAARVQPRLAFLTPTFQNPTGTVMPALTRQEVAQTLAEQALPTLEDDTLIDLGFEIMPPPRLSVLAPDAPILNVGSLSKLYWAGLRVGWLRAAPTLRGPLEQAKTLADFGGSLPSQHVALSLLRTLPGLVAARRAAVTPARDLLAALLRTQLPDWRFTVPGGGQFLWVELPTPHASAFTHVAARYGVRLFPGASMAVGDLPDRYLRLPFTLDPAQLPEAVTRLAAAWTDFRARPGQERLA